MTDVDLTHAVEASTPERHLWLAAFVSVPVAITWTLFLWSHTEVGRLLVWLGLVCAATALLLRVLVRQRRAPGPRSLDRVMAPALGLAGFAWSSLVWHVRPGEAAWQAFVVALMTSLLAANVAFGAQLPLTFQAGQVAVVAPCFVSLLTVGTDLSRDLAIVLVILAAFLELVARSSRAMVRHNALLVVENQRASSESAGWAAQLQRERELLSQIIETVPGGMFWAEPDGCLIDQNERFLLNNGFPPGSQLEGRHLSTVTPRARADEELELFEFVASSTQARLHVKQRRRNDDGTVSEYELSRVPLSAPDGSLLGVLGIDFDVSARSELELKLAEATKLEAIGQLAAGIAHEINTPIQFVGDNLHFLREAFADLSGVARTAATLVTVSAADAPGVTAHRDAVEAADLDFLLGEVPAALEQSTSGLDRVSKIVQAMKDFSHPGSDEMELSDINLAIESTTTVAASEWKYVAELEMVLDENLPLIPCLLNEINQVILNLIVNAAHAITDAGHDSVKRGTITLTTSRGEKDIRIEVADTGTGIPEDVRDRVFEQFFTTKEVGKGTGQGLALAYDVVVNRHRGSIDLESEVGRGTTFVITLPLAPAEGNEEDNRQTEEDN